MGRIDFFIAFLHACVSHAKWGMISLRIILIISTKATQHWLFHKSLNLQRALLNDFASDSVKLKILEVECDFDDKYLLGHAMRVDLLAEGTEMKDASTLIGTIRNDLNAESERLKDREFDLFWTYKQTGSDKENARALMEFCGIEQSVADEIISQK